MADCGLTRCVVWGYECDVVVGGDLISVTSVDGPGIGHGA